MEKLLTFAGCVGGGSRQTVYRMLSQMPGRSIFSRSHDTVFNEIARLVCRDIGKGLTCLPCSTNLDPEVELVCIISDGADIDKCPYTRIMKQHGMEYRTILI